MATETFKVGDGFLQATNMRRKYMRRGSKCPSMLSNDSLPLLQFLDEQETRISDEKKALLLLTEALNLSCSSLEDPTFLQSDSLR